MAGYDLEKQVELYSPENIVEVFVNVAGMPINAYQYDGDSIEICYWKSEYYPYSIEVDNGIIMLECRGGRSGLAGMLRNALFSNNLRHYPVSIAVPRSYGGMLNLCTDNAAIEIANLELFDRLHLKSSNGHISLKNVLSAAYDITTSNGRITAENVAATGVQTADGVEPELSRLTSSNSAIELTGFSALGALFCRTSNGAIRLTDTAVQGDLECKSSNAAITLKQLCIQDKLCATTSNGAINMTRVLARETELKASNGAIKGSVVGDPRDFYIDTGTSNGRCTPSSYDNQYATRSLVAHTSNASIGIDFLQ